MAQSKDRFKVLTDYIGKISVADSLGEWVIDRENDGSPERPFQMPYVNFSDLANSFMDEFYRFSKTHPEYELTNYSEILKRNGLAWGADEMRAADLGKLDEQCVLALIMDAIRAERFCDGAFLGFLNDGSLTPWLKRLKDIDSVTPRRTDKMETWEPYDNGKTVDTAGLDGGTIVNDEEYSSKARITLERGGSTPFGIACGIYGLMFHTAFASDRVEAVNKYEEMKAAVADYMNAEDDLDASDWCGWFADRF